MHRQVEANGNARVFEQSRRWKSISVDVPAAFSEVELRDLGQMLDVPVERADLVHGMEIAFMNVHVVEPVIGATHCFGDPLREPASILQTTTRRAVRPVVLTNSGIIRRV